MDLNKEIDRALEEMEWEDVASTLKLAVHHLLGETYGPPSPVPAGLEFTNIQPAEGQGQDNMVQPGHLYTQPGGVWQEQVRY